MTNPPDQLLGDLPDPESPITIRNAEDMVAAAPVLLGFQPADSVVVVTSGGQRAFHARCNLPPRDADENDLRELEQSVVQPLRRHRVRTVLLLFYSDDPRAVRRAWRVLRRAIEGVGVSVAEALRVVDGRYFPLLAGDRALREVGIPCDVSAHPIRVRAVLQGQVTHPSREALVATIEPDPAAQAAVAALLDDRPVADRLGEGRWLVGLVTRCTDDRAAPQLAADAELARLLLAVRDTVLRDAAWSLIDRESAPEHLRFWSDVLRRAPEHLVPAPAALAGWSAWQVGDGALAWAAVDRCRDADPRYALAHLLAQALEQAVPPDDWEAHWDWAHPLDGRASDDTPRAS